MKMNFKKLPLILSTLLLAFSGVVFWFVYEGIDNNKKIAEQAQTEWSTEATRRNEAKSLDRTMKAIEKERELLDTHFAKSSDIVPFLDTVEKIALKAKIKAEVSSVDILKNNAGLTVGLKATGSFDAIYRFLLLLENSPYELEFNSINLQTNAGEADAGGFIPEWSAIFNIKLLSFLP